MGIIHLLSFTQHDVKVSTVTLLRLHGREVSRTTLDVNCDSSKFLADLCRVHPVSLKSITASFTGAALYQLRVDSFKRLDLDIHTV